MELSLLVDCYGHKCASTIGYTRHDSVFIANWKLKKIFNAHTAIPISCSSPALCDRVFALNIRYFCTSFHTVLLMFTRAHARVHTSKVHYTLKTIFNGGSHSCWPIMHSHIHKHIFWFYTYSSAGKVCNILIKSNAFLPPTWRAHIWHLAWRHMLINTNRYNT